jgi:hypothetical protein
MRVQQQLWSPEAGWSPSHGEAPLQGAQLVFVFFGGRISKENLQPWTNQFPGAVVIGCSTAGEIHGNQVLDDTAVATAVRFDHSQIRTADVELTDAAASYETGRALAGKLEPSGLTHVFVLSDGLHVNGTALVQGLTSVLPAGIGVTGGLAGDGARFASTQVLYGGTARDHRVVAVGFYGARLRVGYGSVGGWDPFGPEREVTRSSGNVLYELDGQSALGLYKKYLGEHAAGLPSSGLLFPLSIRPPGASERVVRTILSVDEAKQSLTFAGDIPEGSLAQLMKANFDRLIEGATSAAKDARLPLGDTATQLAILISCVGRKLVLRQRIEEEVETVREILGTRPVLAGFYSYGEICPSIAQGSSQLHNQTMTVTTFSEQ